MLTIVIYVLTIIKYIIHVNNMTLAQTSPISEDKLEIIGNISEHWLTVEKGRSLNFRRILFPFVTQRNKSLI